MPLRRRRRTPIDLPPLLPGQVIRIGPAAGTGTPTGDYGIGATDLCEFMEFPEQVLQVCGDSFRGQGVGFGGWFSPIALHVQGDSLDDPAGIRYDGITGVDTPLLADPTPPGASQLPAGVVEINRENYLLVTTTQGLRPQTSRLVKALPGQGNWATVPGSQRDAGYAGGRQSQISGYYDPIPTADSASGWIYLVANDFDRSGPVVLYRALPQTFTDRATWQGWSDAQGWGHEPTPLWDDRVGEMSVRQIDGKTVLSYFNASTGNMEVRVAERPDRSGHRAGDDGRRRHDVARSRGKPAHRRRSTGWPSHTAGTSHRGPRSTRCGCSSVSGTPQGATGRRTGSSSSRSTRSSRNYFNTSSRCGRTNRRTREDIPDQCSRAHSTMQVPTNADPSSTPNNASAASTDPIANAYPTCSEYAT